jgi:hypothetical protein
VADKLTFSNSESAELYSELKNVLKEKKIAQETWDAIDNYFKNYEARDIKTLLKFVRTTEDVIRLDNYTIEKLRNKQLDELTFDGIYRPISSNNEFFKKLERKWEKKYGEHVKLLKQEGYTIRFLDLIKNVKVMNTLLEKGGPEFLKKGEPKFLDELLMDNNIYNVVAVEAMDGLKKVISYRHLKSIQNCKGIEKPTIGEDWNEKLKKTILDVYGFSMEGLTVEELNNCIEGVISLSESDYPFKTVFDKKRNSREILAGYSPLNCFKKLVNMLPRYWDKTEVKLLTGILQEKGVDVNQLKGKAWTFDYKREKEEEIKFEDAVKYFVYAVYDSTDPSKKDLVKESAEQMKSILPNFNFAKRFIQKYVDVKQDLYSLLEDGFTSENCDKIVDLFVGSKTVSDGYHNLIEKIAESGIKQSIHPKYQGNRRTINPFDKDDDFDRCQEAFMDLFSTISNIKSGRVYGKHVIGFYGKHLPLAFRADKTCSCTDMPSGQHGAASVYYLLDPRVIQIGYATVEEFEKGKEIDAVRNEGYVNGKVISYLCKNDSTGNLVYVVDSIEGGHNFRPWMEKNYKQIYEDILRVAKDVGAKEVIFDIDKDFCSTTTKSMLSKFKTELWQEHSKPDGNFENLRTFNTSILGYPDIPYDTRSKERILIPPCTFPYLPKILGNVMTYFPQRDSHYLEAWSSEEGEWRVPEGKVTGYFVKL